MHPRYVILFLLLAAVLPPIGGPVLLAYGLVVLTNHLTRDDSTPAERRAASRYATAPPRFASDEAAEAHLAAIARARAEETA